MQVHIHGVQYVIHYKPENKAILTTINFQHSCTDAVDISKAVMIILISIMGNTEASFLISTEFKKLCKRDGALGLSC